jgi:glycosyltransferase involved in cell wall biosynthesis
VYDRRVCAELSRLGWSVHEHLVAGDWPRPDDVALTGLATTLSRLPDGARVLVDGLLASAAEEVVVLAAARLRLVVLLHMPLGTRDAAGDLDAAGVSEGAVLAASAAVVVTSGWTRRRLLELYALDGPVVHVATPGVDLGEPAAGSRTGGVLVCVGAVVPAKGHDVLVGALGELAGLPWRCICAGALDLDPDHVAGLQQQAEDGGVAERLHFAGVLAREELERTYTEADLLVLPSRAETYGMVVAEALAHGLPVVASDVGGVREAVGAGPGGPPGLLVPPDDRGALANALRAWLQNPGLRERLRRAARQRRPTLTGWETTARTVALALMHEPDPDGIRVARADPWREVGE